MGLVEYAKQVYQAMELAHSTEYSLLSWVYAQIPGDLSTNGMQCFEERIVVIVWGEVFSFVMQCVL